MNFFGIKITDAQFKAAMKAASLGDAAVAKALEFDWPIAVSKKGHNITDETVGQP